MGDAGFYRGTSAEQDSRFTDKQKKLLKSMRFEESLSRKVNMKKVNLDVIKPWITKRINQILGIEDDVVIEYVFSQLEEERQDPRIMQINLTGFLNAKKAREFMGELWKYLADATETDDGIPPALIEMKKQELERKADEDKANIFSASEIKEEIANFNRNARHFSPETGRDRRKSDRDRWEFSRGSFGAGRFSRFSERDRNGRYNRGGGGGGGGGYPERRESKEEPESRELKREQPRRESSRERPRRQPESKKSPPRKSRSRSPERRKPRRRFTEDKKDKETEERKRTRSSSSDSDSRKTREVNSRRRKFKESSPVSEEEEEKKPKRKFREAEVQEQEPEQGKKIRAETPPSTDSDTESKLRSHKATPSEVTGEETKKAEEAAAVDTTKMEEEPETKSKSDKKKKKKHKKHKKHKKQKKMKKRAKTDDTSDSEDEKKEPEPDAKKPRQTTLLENELREKALKSMSKQQKAGDEDRSDPSSSEAADSD